jgi:anti-sigma-K factor RskA
MSNFLIDEDTDLLAAEFVLGTLDSEERANAQSLLRTDHGFIAMVRIWERRFGELHLMVEPVEPDAKIFQRIKAKVVEIAPREPIPEDKAPPAMMPGPEPPAAMGATAAPVAAEIAPPAEPPVAAGEAAVAPALTAGAEPPQPAEPVATGEVPAPDAALTAVEAAVASVPGAEAGTAEAVAKPDDGATETIAKPENGTTEKAEIAVPPPLVQPAEPRPDLKVADQRRPAREETTAGLIRSRRRWRALGIGMTLLVAAFAAMVVAWKFAPDRLPARLRPTEVMTWLGVEPPPRPVPAVKLAPPPESQFDE